MSIYRNDIYRVSDVFATRPAQRRLDPREEPPTKDFAEEPRKHQRKAAPANTPFPRTMAWAASLRSEVRPTALLDRYARIANLLAVTWPDGKAFDAYMESLLTDRRGGRQGFPADVLRELTTLALVHSEEALIRDAS